MKGGLQPRSGTDVGGHINEEEIAFPSAERRSAGATGGLRQPLHWPSTRPFKILSIDGGGIKGIFPASVLAKIEEEFCSGASAGEYFDLITGTSTGGIIALGLGLGIPAKSILDLYTEKGGQIFPRSKGALGMMSNWWRIKRRFLRCSYDRAPLEAALREVFKGELLGSANRRICIPSFEGRYGEVFIFKTPHHPDFKKDWQEGAVDVALATAAAPTFFKAYKNGDRVFADGGVWANNPVMIGLVDALTTTTVERRNVHILSLSCGDLDLPFTACQVGAGGLFQWREIINSAMHLASQNATGQAGLLIGRDQLTRIEPPPEGARIAMDDFANAAAVLPSYGRLAVEGKKDELRRFFSPRLILPLPSTVLGSTKADDLL